MSTIDDLLVILIVLLALSIAGGFVFMAFHTTPGTVTCYDGESYTGTVNVYWHDEMYRVETDAGTVYAPKAICTFAKDGE